jgi:hypothetical protein
MGGAHPGPPHPGGRPFFEPFRATDYPIGLLQNSAESGFIPELAAIYSTHARASSIALVFRSLETFQAKGSSVPVQSGAVPARFLLRFAARGFLRQSPV